MKHLQQDFALSVVIPTYNRKAIVLDTLKALTTEGSSNSFEVIVLVDGSNDGTFTELQEIEWDLNIRFFFHENRGLAATRNRGGKLAQSEIILFIDDDMRACQNLIDEHIKHHTANIDVAVGRIGFDPSSPDTLIGSFVSSWTEEFHQQLLKDGITTGMHVQGGHFSIKKSCFDQLGGFKEAYNEGGRYGNEDMDFGLRLFESGFKVEYASTAKADQYYGVTAKERFKQIRDLASADVLFADFSQDTKKILEDNKKAYGRVPNRYFDKLSRMSPRLVYSLQTPIRTYLCKLIDQGSNSKFTNKWFAISQGLAYRSGLADASHKFD